MRSSIDRFVQKPQMKKSITLLAFYRREIIIGLVSLLLLAQVIGVGLQLYHNVQRKNALETQRKQLLAEEAYWQKITKQYPDYRDAYYKLALLSYQLGEKQKAKEHLEKALSLDPNFEAGRELEKLLGGDVE